MQTLLVNGAALVSVALLLFAPGFLIATSRRPSALLFATSAAGVLLVASIVTYLVSVAHGSPIIGLRVLGGLLAVCLVGSLVRVVLNAGTARDRPSGGVDRFAVVAGVLIGLWVTTPQVKILAEEHLNFGLVDLGNADLPNYVLAGQNIASTGFADSHHLANVNMGAFSEGTYVGSYTVLVFMSSVTGLSILQVALATMGIAVCLMAVALWALGNSIWPDAPAAVGLSVAAGCLCSLSVYSYSEYFLGATLGVASLATVLAGAIECTRGGGRMAPLCICAGGGFGVYTYGQLILPELLVLPVVSLGVSFVLGLDTRRALRSCARVLVGVLGGLLAAAPFLPTARTLAMSQSQVVAGWTLPAIDGLAATVWPQSLGHASSPTWLIVTWGGIAVLVFGSLFAAALYSGPTRRCAILATLVFAGCAVVVGGCVVGYGASRYQTWKMETFLLPIAVVAGLPALGVAVGPLMKLRRGTLTAMVGAVTLGPWLLWAPWTSAVEPVVATSGALIALPDADALRDVAAVNVRLSAPLETMNVGAALNNTTIVFTQNSYYQPLTSTSTCTLTEKSLLSPGETDYVPLGGKFVLLQRPSTCLMRR